MPSKFLLFLDVAAQIIGLQFGHLPSWIVEVSRFFLWRRVWVDYEDGVCGFFLLWRIAPCFALRHQRGNL